MFRSPKPQGGPRAFRLQGAGEILLRELSRLGNGTLVMRRQGLSLAKVAEFGVGSLDWETGVFREPVSGLEIDLQSPRSFYLLQCPDDGRPVFAIGSPGLPVDVSIHLNQYLWNSTLIDEVIAHFNGIPLLPSESWQLGASAWLDEWPGSGDVHHPCASFPEILAAFKRCEFLETEIHAPGHRCLVSFRPSFVDSAGPVVRIADKSRNHVVFADVTSTSFQIHRLSRTRLGIGPSEIADTTKRLISNPAA